MTEQNEKYLIGRLKKGDKDAFRQLFEHYYPLFLAFARKISFRMCSCVLGCFAKNSTKRGA